MLSEIGKEAVNIKRIVQSLKNYIDGSLMYGPIPSQSTTLRAIVATKLLSFSRHHKVGGTLRNNNSIQKMKISKMSRDRRSPRHQSKLQ